MFLKLYWAHWIRGKKYIYIFEIIDWPFRPMLKCKIVTCFHTDNACQPLKILVPSSPYPTIQIDCTAKSLPLVNHLLSIDRDDIPSGIIPHGEISWATHTIRSLLKVRVLCLPSLSWDVCVCGVGVSVRARGLCDISRLPIWLGEWTPSNYSCSYCLINLPVSLPHPLNTHSIFFHPLLQRSRAKEKNNWVTENHIQKTVMKANQIIVYMP